MSTPAEMCSCVMCGECGGNGRVRYATAGYPEWELDTCLDCGGSGYSEECSYCQEVGSARKDAEDARA